MKYEYNNIKFPPEVLKKAIDEYQKDIEFGRAFGELDPTKKTKIEFPNVSHKIQSINDNTIKIEFLKTDMGILAESMKNQLELKIRGIGRFEEDDIKELKIISFDLVNKG